MEVTPVKTIAARCVGAWFSVVCVLGAGAPCVAEVAPGMRCADLNVDGTLNVADPVFLLRWLFLEGPAPSCAGVSGTCGDVDADGEAGLGDVHSLLGWLFLGDAEITCAAGCANAEAPEIEGFAFVGCNAEGYPEYTHDGTGIVFVRLPGGTFDMGSPEDEPYRKSDEGPVHEVGLSPFLIAKYEVTQGEWHAVMGSYPSYFDGTKDYEGRPVDPPDDSDRLPVERVSWNDIQEFEEKTGLTLPTEAQWEYAARGGTETAFSFGSGDSCADWRCAACEERDPYLWYCGNAEGRTHPVGTKLANPFGLHDMHGNVSEWCEDVYSSSFYSEPEALGPDPLCTSGSGDRVGRGGYWFYVARLCRSARRLEGAPRTRDFFLGFRPAGRHAGR